MRAHELARWLLLQPDVPVLIPGHEWGLDDAAPEPSAVGEYSEPVEYAGRYGTIDEDMGEFCRTFHAIVLKRSR